MSAGNLSCKRGLLFNPRWKGAAPTDRSQEKGVSVFGLGTRSGKSLLGIREPRKVEGKRGENKREEKKRENVLQKERW